VAKWKFVSMVKKSQQNEIFYIIWNGHDTVQNAPNIKKKLPLRKKN
jgi:hypothetical protein